MSELFSELPAEESSPKIYREDRKTYRKKRMRRTGIALFIVTALVVIASVVAWPHVKTLAGITDVEDYPGPGTTEVLVTIPQGATGTEIGQILKDKGVVASREAFVRAFRDDPRAQSIQAGTFTLKKEMSGQGAVVALLDPNSRAELKLTVPEGTTAKAVATKMAEVFGTPEEDVLALMDSPESLGLPAEAGGNIEGWIAPATYTFSPETTPEQAFRKMITKRVGELKELGIPAEKWQRTIIVASIIEREVNWPEYYGQVARVIENRLAGASETNGKLQMDSTILYGIGESGRNPTVEEKNDAGNKYNTYQNAGLPPGPISNPRIETLAAAANPPKGDWLYFVTVNTDTGETKFSATHAEHVKYVEEYKQWAAKKNADTAKNEPTDEASDK